VAATTRTLTRGVIGQLAVLPTCQSFIGANPKAPVTRDEQSPNAGTGEMLTRRWRPRDAPNTIEANQAEFFAEPEITIGRLSNRVNDTFKKAVTGRPRSVRVLIHVERRIQVGRTTAIRQADAKRDNEPFLHSHKYLAPSLSS